MSEPYLCCLAFYFLFFYLKKTCFSLWRAALFRALNCFSVGWPVFRDPFLPLNIMQLKDVCLVMFKAQHI